MSDWKIRGLGPNGLAIAMKDDFGVVLLLCREGEDPEKVRMAFTSECKSIDIGQLATVMCHGSPPRAEFMPDPLPDEAERIRVLGLDA